LVIDHINMVKSDNRICNLREVAHCDNLRNSDQKPGKTGVRGVYFTPDGNICSAWSIKGVRGWSKSFNVADLGFDEAVNRAKAVRDEAIANWLQK
jgi:hypothetical protein